MNQLQPIPPADDPIRLDTQFGQFDVDPRDIVGFPDGLPGFERCRRFVVIASQDTAPMQLLQAVEGQAASFLAIDPRVVLPSYRCGLTPADLLRLGAGAETPLVWLALVAVDGAGQATVNLRAPIVINPERMVGFQVVPSNSVYPLRYPLAAE
jgi:flagellar assembly factor FliW